MFGGKRPAWSINSLLKVDKWQIIVIASQGIRGIIRLEMSKGRILQRALKGTLIRIDKSACCSSITFITWNKAEGWSKSSWSNRLIYSPAAISIAAFVLAEIPRFLDNFWYFTLGSFWHTRGISFLRSRAPDPSHPQTQLPFGIGLADHRFDHLL